MEKDLQAYLEYLVESKHLAANTLASYHRDLDQYLNYLKACHIVDLESVQKIHVQQYLRLLHEKKRATSSIMRMLSSIKNFHLYLQLQQKTTHNPASTIEMAKLAPKVPTYLTIAEVNHLLQQPDITTHKGIRDRAILELLYATGLKVSECIALKVQEVHTDLAYLEYQAKGKKIRVLPLGSECVKWLQMYLTKSRKVFAKNQEEQVLFLTQQGKAFTRQGLWKNMKQYVLQAGLKKEVTPQTLRHSLAIHLLENGADLASVQELLGHVDLSTTQMYVQATKKRLSESYQQYFPRA